MESMFRKNSMSREERKEEILYLLIVRQKNPEKYEHIKTKYLEEYKEAKDFLKESLLLKDEEAIDFDEHCLLCAIKHIEILRLIEGDKKLIYRR